MTATPVRLESKRSSEGSRATRLMERVQSRREIAVIIGLGQ